MTDWLLAVLIISNFAYTQYLIYDLRESIEDFMKRSLKNDKRT